jgi:hypothetical protein
MASTPEQPQPVSFTTQTAYPLPTPKFLIPTTWKRYQLSQLVNKALSLSRVVPFDFLVKGEILRTSLSEWCAENGMGEVSVAICSAVHSSLYESCRAMCCAVYRKRRLKSNI